MTHHLLFLIRVNSRLIFFVFPIALLYIASPLPAQTWSPLPAAPIPSSRINDVYFVDIQTGWIADGAGQIHRTTDGGASWQPQFSNATTHFRSIGFTDALHGWAGALGIGDINHPTVTDTSILYATTNGGVTWTPDPKISGSIARGFCGMQVVNDTVIFGVGRVRGPAYFYRTTDGGTTWLTKNMSAYAAGLIDVLFFSVDSGIAVGLTNINHDSSSGIVLSTTDRGDTWQVVHTTPRIGEWCWKITFPSRSVGYVSLQRNALSPIYILKTTDGGGTWQDKLLVPFSYFVQGIGFVSETRGWVGGNSASAYETTDGGNTWQAIWIGRRANRIRFLDAQHGYAAGETVYKFAPAATSALADTELPSTHLNSASFPNPFNPSTTIRFEVNPSFTTSHVRLSIFDGLGREVAVLVEDELESGKYERTWNAQGMASGTYYYSLKIRGRVETRKIVLVR